MESPETQPANPDEESADVNEDPTTPAEPTNPNVGSNDEEAGGEEQSE